MHVAPLILLDCFQGPLTEFLGDQVSDNEFSSHCSVSLECAKHRQQFNWACGTQSSKELEAICTSVADLKAVGKTLSYLFLTISCSHPSQRYGPERLAIKLN